MVSFVRWSGGLFAFLTTILISSDFRARHNQTIEFMAVKLFSLS